MEDLKDSSLVSIPRSYHQGITGGVCSYALCGFCDASTTASIAVVYLVVKTEKTTHKPFLACKTRVATLKTATIPRMELLSALLLARLINTVSSVLKSTFLHLKMECYTDSMIALYWVKGTSKEWNLLCKIDSMRYV